MITCYIHEILFFLNLIHSVINRAQLYILKIGVMCIFQNGTS